MAQKTHKMKSFFIAKIIVIIILGGMVTYGISNIFQNSNEKKDTQISPDDFVYNRAHDIASTVSEILLKQLPDDETFNVNTRTTEKFFGGKVTYVVEDNFFENDSLIEIKVTAKYNDVTTIITTDISRETKQKKRINVSYVYE